MIERVVREHEDVQPPYPGRPQAGEHGPSGGPLSTRTAAAPCWISVASPCPMSRKEIVRSRGGSGGPLRSDGHDAGGERAGSEHRRRAAPSRARQQAPGERCHDGRAVDRDDAEGTG